MDTGSVEDGRVYTTHALAHILGYRQSRTLERYLFEIECPVRRLGGKKLVSGKQFRLALERTSCTKTSNAGS